MAVERYGSKTDVVVKLILVFFISLLSFSIGTFVGKKFSDNQHKLSQLEPSHESSDSESTVTEEATHDDRGVASIAPDINSVKPGDPLSDEEIAKLAEEFVSDDETTLPAAKKEDKLNDKNAVDHKEAKSESHQVAPVAHVAATPVASHASSHPAEPSHEAQKVAEGKAPTAAVKKMPAAQNSNRIPTSLPAEVAASAAGKYTVQVGAYPKEEEAKNIAKELKDKGFSAFYIDVKIKGQTWYRVNVGLFSTEKEAKAYKDDLLARSKVSSAFVQKISK